MRCLAKAICSSFLVVPLLFGFRCLCEAGYAGSLCEVDINDCDSDPCLNGGICIDGVDTFKCQCLSGKTGVLLFFKNLKLVCITTNILTNGAPGSKSSKCSFYRHKYIVVPIFRYELALRPYTTCELVIKFKERNRTI